MVKINVDNMSLKELVALDAKIKAALADARAKGKAELKDKVAALAQQHGFSVNELFGGVRNKTKSVGIAKYANPDDPTQTWTGRGRKPLWVIANLKKGKKLDALAI
jgi:DNA-binding protein H-NS